VLDHFAILKTKEINRLSYHFLSSSSSVPPEPDRDFVAFGDRVDYAHCEFVV